MNKTIALKLKSSEAKFAKSRESLGSDFTVLALEEELVNILNARKKNSVVLVNISQLNLTVNFIDGK